MAAEIKDFKTKTHYKNWLHATDQISKYSILKRKGYNTDEDLRFWHSVKKDEYNRYKQEKKRTEGKNLTADELMEIST